MEDRVSRKRVIDRGEEERGFETAEIAAGDGDGDGDGEFPGTEWMRRSVKLNSSRVFVG